MSETEFGSHTAKRKNTSPEHVSTPQRMAKHHGRQVQPAAEELSHITHTHQRITLAQKHAQHSASASDRLATHDSSHDQHAGAEAHDAAEPARTRRRRKVPMRRLNLNLTATVYAEIERLAEQDGRTMTEVLRIGLGLAHLAATARRNSGQLAIIDADGSLHRIVLPY